MSGQQLSLRVDPRSDGVSSRRAKRLLLAALAGCLLVAGLASAVPSALAASTPMVDLGTASSYAVLSGASVGNTVSAPTAPHTTLRGGLAVKANTAPTGFPPGVVTGAFDVGNAAAVQAHDDAVAAYTEVANRTGGDVLPGVLAGATVLPGLHSSVGAVSNTGTVTFDGVNDPNAVFVLKVNGALAMAAASHVVLINGARASRVFWQVNAAGSIGAGASFAGTLMALDAVAVGAGTVFNGRAFALNGALTLDANEFYSAPPVVTITGGISAITTDTTPTISGTTDVEAPALVTVTVNGQTLTATPSGGAWSVTSAILANADYPVVASVTDGAGNPGSATQVLTVDTVLPVVTLAGGPSVTTNDPTPTIAGTSDAAPGTIIHVAVDSQTLTALVQAGGTWNVTPSTLIDGTRVVTVSVTDPAGNLGTASQGLTVDTVAPVVTIDGGASALTNDATPAISGTAEVAPGTTVTVTVADETLTSPVQGDGTWSVSAAGLTDGPHLVIMTVSDAAGNAASFTQTLTVDAVSPAMTITGGTLATTDDLSPTMAGTSDAAPGTTVTVAIAGQTLTTLLQANGTWNVTPALVAEGTWTVVASAPDPAGNVGSATQTLTIAADLVPAPGPAGPSGPAGPIGGSGPTGESGPTGAPGATGAPGPIGTRGPTGGTGATGGTGPIGGNGATGKSGPLGVTGSPLTIAAGTTVARAGSQKVGLSSLSVGMKVTAPARGRIVAIASGTVRITGSKKAIKLSLTTTAVAAGHSATLKLKPMGTTMAAQAAFASIKAAIAMGTVVTATITVKIVDSAGNARDVTRTVTLT
jgi:hypothetical protein